MLFFLRVSGSIGTRIYRELHGNFLDDKRTKQKHLKTLVWILKPGLLGSVRLSFSSFPLGVAVALHLFCISLCQPNPPNQFKFLCFSDFPSGESDLKENSRLKFRLAIRDNFLTLTGSQLEAMEQNSCHHS